MRETLGALAGVGLLVTTSAFAQDAAAPVGVWALTFEDRAVGFSNYVGRTEALSGQTFRPSDFLDPDLIEFMRNVPDLRITVNPLNGSVSLSGAGGTGPRTIQINSEGFGVSTTPLASSQENPAPGCVRFFFITEALRLDPTNPDRMLYSQNHEVRYNADTASPQACDSFLTSLGENIRTGEVGAGWIALQNTGALDLDNITRLRSAITIYFFEARRISR